MQTRQQWLLLFLGADGGPYKVDQVRAMKGLFLLSEVPGHPVADFYKFEPYDYGPFDSAVYRDLDALEAEGLVGVQRYMTSSKREFGLTDKGRVAFEEIKAVTPETLFDEVTKVKRLVTSLSFGDLLTHIYANFERHRERSIAPEALAFP